MKSQLITIITTIFAIVFLPISCLSVENSTEKTLMVSANSQKIEQGEVFFSLLRKESGKIEKISANDYLCGVLAAEMPASYETEALKAQAVAAYTFALYRKERTKEKYDITDDYKTDQSYTPLSQAQEKWGEKSSEYTAKIKSAVASVSGMYLSYENKTALSVYHAISSGKTESCKEVWGNDIPYLVAVDSAFDKTSPSYISTLTLSAAELKEKLKGYTITGSAQDYFKNIKKTDSGRVKTLNLCGKEVTGSDIQKALSLRSAIFDVVCQNDSFTFTVYGYGHGVGMSQYGANAMAKQGSSYKEILYHYYKGCKIKN